MSGVPATSARSDAGLVLLWFAVLGVIGGVIWEQVVPLAAFTRTADNGVMDEAELARQFGATGWFFVIAAVGGLLSGLVLLLWRRRAPVLMVFLVAIGGALATFVMVQVGLALGPPDPEEVLPRTAVGDRVPVQLTVGGFAVYFTWSIAALTGALLALWGSDAQQHRRAEDDLFPVEAPRNG